MLMAVAAVLQAEAAEGVDLLQLRQNLARVAKYCFKLVAAAVAVAAEVMAAVLAVVVAVTIPAAVIYVTNIRKITQPRYVKRSQNYGIMNGFVEEMFSGQKTIMAYAYENRVAENFDRVNQNAADAYYNADYYGMTMGPTVNSINNLGLTLIAVFGSFLYMGGRISLGQISSFVL